MERHMLCLILLLFTTYYFLFQKKNMDVGDGWVGWAIAHIGFSRSVSQLLPYPCSHFYVDFKFGNRLYSKEKRRAWREYSCSVKEESIKMEILLQKLY